MLGVRINKMSDEYRCLVPYLDVSALICPKYDDLLTESSGRTDTPVEVGSGVSESTPTFSGGSLEDKSRYLEAIKNAPRAWDF